MPTIEQAVKSNAQRDGSGSPVKNMPFTPLSSSSTAPALAASGLPVRGMFPPNLLNPIDSSTVDVQFRVNVRSGMPLPSQAVVRTRTPQSLSGKVLVAPVIGTGGSKIARYNTITITISPASVAANSAATQTFAVPGVQAADRIIGYQWNAAQKIGVATLAVRVVSEGNIAIDFYNPTAGGLVPTGGSVTIFLVQ